MKKLSYILLIVAGGLLLSGCQGYNRMVEKQEAVTSQWGNVQNAYQRRADLIPNLVNTVKGYAEHEQETFTQVTEARAKATQTNINPENLTAESLQEYQQAQNQLSQALGRLLLIQENYPELKANQNFLELQREISDTENKIQASRRFYNGNVREMNIKVHTFPSMIIASMLKFKEEPFFEMENEEERKNVKVEF